MPGLLTLILGGLDKLGFSQPETYGPAITGISILLSLAPIEDRASDGLPARRKTCRVPGRGRRGYLSSPSFCRPEDYPGNRRRLCVCRRTPVRLERGPAFNLGGRPALRVRWSACAFTMRRLFFSSPWVIFARSERKRADIGLAVVAGAGTFSLFGVVDWLTWGIPFVSYVRAIEVNVLYGVAAQFGEMPFYFYFAAFPFGVILALLARPRLAQNEMAPCSNCRYRLCSFADRSQRASVHLRRACAHRHGSCHFIGRLAQVRFAETAVRPGDLPLRHSHLRHEFFAGYPNPSHWLSADYRAAVAKLRAEPDLRALAAYGVGRL